VSSLCLHGGLISSAGWGSWCCRTNYTHHAACPGLDYLVLVHEVQTAAARLRAASMQTADGYCYARGAGSQDGAAAAAAAQRSV
jgi:hypothetical protein